MTSKPLFRTETETARSTSWLGRVVLISPLSFGVLSVAALAMALVIAGFFIFGEYTRKARVSGVLAPAHGVVKVLAQQAGMVESLTASEGAAITRDGLLLVLGDGRASRSREDLGAAMTARIAARRSALDAQRRFTIAASWSEQGSLVERKTGLEREIRQVDREMLTQEGRARLSESNAERARRLESIGFLSQAAYEHEQDGAMEQASRLEAVKRSRITLVRDLAALEFEMSAARARAQSQLAAIDVQRASLDQEQLERDIQFHATIVAPASGTVATVLVEPGQMVTAGTPLVTIIPSDATLEAHLFSPSRSIGFVRAGQEVLLRYLAYPHQKFGMQKAQVVAISKNPMLPAELGFTPIDGSREPLYRIKAVIESQSMAAYGRPEPLQAGMQVEADILLDRRRLVEWIFEPLLSLAGRT